MKVKAVIPYTVEGLGALMTKFNPDPSIQHRITENQRQHFSFVPSVTHNDNLAYQPFETAFILVKVRIEEKIIPAASVNDMLNERVTALYRESGQRVSKEQRADIKEDIIVTLIPTALVKTTYVPVICDLVSDRVYVVSTQYRHAEIATTMLRDEINTFPSLPFTVDHSVSVALSGAMHDLQAGRNSCLYPHFKVSDACKVVEKDEGASITMKGTWLPDEELIAYLNQGLDVVQIKLTTGEQENTQFTLKDDLRISGLKFGDILFDSEDESPDASLIIVCSVIRELYDNLADVFSDDTLDYGMESDGDFEI